MIKYYEDLEQGSDEWHALRCGRLSASEMNRIITAKTLKYAENGESRIHLFELLAQRVSGRVEPQFISDDMLRGREDEVDARIAYDENFSPVKTCGGITNDKWGFTLWYSPDGLVGDDGLIECKSRRQKYQVQTIITDEVPSEYIIQIQTGLLISERKWCDFISYSSGWHMVPIRVEADPVIQDAIVRAATAFEDALQEKLDVYHEHVRTNKRLVPTEYRDSSAEIYL